jgi:riboflavin synthase
MFTGIVQGLAKVKSVEKLEGLTRYSIELPSELTSGLQLGASVSVDGVCQTVIRTQGAEVWFDAIQESLDRSTLQFLKVGKNVNVERAARFGDEIGGHLLSGHVYGRAQISNILESGGARILTFKCPAEWMRFLFSKGFIAIDGVSLTLVDVSSDGSFSVHLIPETLNRTVLGKKVKGDHVNVEMDSQTQAIVETVERVLAQKKSI